MKKLTNENVYLFLNEEIAYHPELKELLGNDLQAIDFNSDFWVTLQEHLDCFRICDECGKPMIEGYVVDGCNTYCSEECLHKHLTNEEFEKRYNNGDGNTYWTTWYEDSITFKTSDYECETVY